MYCRAFKRYDIISAGRLVDKPFYRSRIIRKSSLFKYLIISVVTLLLVFVLTLKPYVRKASDAPLITPSQPKSEEVPSQVASRYKKIASLVDENRLQEAVSELSSYGSRVAGYPGSRKAADYIVSELRKTGIKDVKTEPFGITVPVDNGGSITVAGQQFRIHGIWPNLVRTSQLPPDGIKCNLIYAGRASLPDFNGKDVEGSGALVEFNCGTEWLNAPRLGAKLIIFVEPETTMRGEAEAKYSAIPLSIPRFWISKKDAEAVKNLISSGKAKDAVVKCDMPWEREKAVNIIAKIEGSDPKLKNQIVVIHSYYDGMSIVPAIAPAADTSCGASAMLEMARILKQVPPKRTVWLMSTSGHFMSLAGMRAYIDRHMDEYRKVNTLDKVKKWLNRRGSHYKIPDAPKVYLYLGLDLTSRTQGVGVMYKGYFYDIREDQQGKFSDIATKCREHSAGVASTLGFSDSLDKRFADCVNQIGGKSWRNYIPGMIALDTESLTLAGAMGMSFVSINDARPLVDTPFDTVDQVNVKNLSKQVTMISCLVDHILRDPNKEQGKDMPYSVPFTEPSTFSRLYAQGGHAVLGGQAVCFDPKRSFVPNLPVPDCLAVVRSYNKSYMGVRANMIESTLDYGKSDEWRKKNPGLIGRYKFAGVAPLTAYNNQVKTSISAYKIDRITGEIISAPDQGVYGEFYPTEIKMTTGVKETPIILFNCVSSSVYDLLDPQGLCALSTMDVYDGTTNGKPRAFGYALAVPEPQNPHIENMAVIFSNRNARLKLIMGSGPAATRLVLINSHLDKRGALFTKPETAEGTGYDVGNGITFQNTALKVTQDLWNLDEFRIQRLKKYRIINEGLDSLHTQAKLEMQKAQKALNMKDYAAFDACCRAAWGYEIRAYPSVQATAKDVVKGVLFYLALMLPFAFFTERLLVGSTKLTWQLIWFFIIFMLVFFIFWQVHPAFQITMNPTIVLLAFIMLALSSLVIGLVASRFDTLVKTFNQQVGGVHNADIGRMSVAAAAFSLGISNMRRRKARTILTCITLIVLTFLVLSFTSVVQSLKFNKIPAKHDEGAYIYNGVMIRTPMWDPLQEIAYQLIDDEFGEKYPVAPRAWYFGAQLGEQSFLTLERGDKSFDAKAAVGFTQQEASILDLNGKNKTIISAGDWFGYHARKKIKDWDNSYEIILPTKIAEALDVKPADVGKAKVSFAGINYTVIGIIDSNKFKKVTDLDGESMTPADFILMSKMSSQGKGTGDTGFSQYMHMEPDNCFFIPYKTVMNMGGNLRSLAIGYASADDVRYQLDRLMPRLGLNLYAGIGDSIYRYSSIGSSSSKGFNSVFIPILIASLIVLNTMLGSVYERVKEIGIFSSIGLAPAHIAVLFIAESLVYAVLGAVAGYVIGQGASKVLTMTGWLPDLYLNFSSKSAVWSTMIVVFVVIASTLYPAKKASEVATPSIERSWKVPDPVGDLWQILLPFAVTGEQAKGVNGFLAEWFRAYEDYSIGEFVTEGVDTDTVDTKYGKGYRVKSRTWLAPFDLGVSQMVELMTIPTDMEDVYEVKVSITRESGDVSNWKRVNRRFLNIVRKQFLIWRTMKEEDREKYLSCETADTQPEAKV
ncbi:MAG: FtsX-like permease family protein [Armatimonadota bacterium]